MFPLIWLSHYVLLLLFFLHYLHHGLFTIVFPFSYLLWNAKLEPGIYRKQLDYFHKVGVKFAYTQPFSDSTCGITFDTLFAHCSLPLKFNLNWHKEKCWLHTSREILEPWLSGQVGSLVECVLVSLGFTIFWHFTYQ